MYSWRLMSGFVQKTSIFVQERGEMLIPKCYWRNISPVRTHVLLFIQQRYKKIFLHKDASLIVYGPGFYFLFNSNKYTVKFSEAIYDVL